MDSLGLYVSVPFCRAKCSFCNFASGVFAGERIDGYLDRVIEEMRGVGEYAWGLGASVPRTLDTVYFGGGTPSLLSEEQVRRVFAAIRGEFTVEAGAEVTVEGAPGQLTNEVLEAMLECGVNRLSFGVQSFVDGECQKIGRTHTGGSCREEMRRVAAAGVARVGVDLIAGLPGQTFASWKYSVEQAIATGVEHVSVYMLEIDDGSRLGREKLSGGVRYGAGELPDGDQVADCYAAACEWLEDGGVGQYEISNFARAGGQSRHNRRYWERRPYVGLGLDAHSMLRVGDGAVRWANGKSMEEYAGFLGEAKFARTVDRVGVRESFEEALFLGLRLVEGVEVSGLDRGLVEEVRGGVEDCVEAGLMECGGGRWRLTGAGRMASNEVFERVLVGVGCV